jgi:hypothetical protein
VSTSEETSLVAQRGPYDDEDYAPALAIDSRAVYWTAAPEDTSSTYDEGPSILYRTCR